MGEYMNAVKMKRPFGSSSSNAVAIFLGVSFLLAP